MDRTPHSGAYDVDSVIDIGDRKVERVFNSPSPLRSDLVGRLVNACNGSPAAELCGLIDETQNEHFIENIHESPQHNFLMDRGEFKETVRRIIQIDVGRIIGVFHTHPRAEPWPTPRDIVGWPNPELGWRYFIVTHNDVIEWRLL